MPNNHLAVLQILLLNITFWLILSERFIYRWYVVEYIFFFYFLHIRSHIHTHKYTHACTHKLIRTHTSMQHTYTHKQTGKYTILTEGINKHAHTERWVIETVLTLSRFVFRLCSVFRMIFCHVASGVSYTSQRISSNYQLNLHLLCLKVTY